MAYSQAWLEDNTVRRCILVVANVYDVVAATTVPVYLSTTGYLTQDSVTSFLPIISGGMNFTESISLDGGISLSYGDVEFHNQNGDYDTWLNSSLYIWVNNTIKVYYGDPEWQIANIAAIGSTFQLVFDGIIADIDSKDRTKLNIKVRDKLERLNTPLTETKLGTYGTWAGGQTNEDAIRPLVFGEIHNAEPLLIDPSTLQYMYHGGSSEGLLEIRDNGVPVYTSGGILPGGATVSTATGTYTLTSPLVGTSTVSVQGARVVMDLNTGVISAGYSNNIANIIAVITTQFGNSFNRLLIADLDLVNLAAFQTANPQPVGILITDRENTLSICQTLADSIGAQLYFTRTGLLQLLRLGVPTSDASVTITDSDILHHSLNIVNRSSVVASTKIGFAKNHSVQSGLITGIPQVHKDLFAEEWLTVTVTDSSVRTLYKLNADPPQKDTCLIVEADALAEATRLNNYNKVVRTVYGFTGSAKLLSLKLGQPVVLTHNRFGLSAGVSGQVVSLSPNWLKGLVDVEVII